VAETLTRSLVRGGHAAIKGVDVDGAERKTVVSIYKAPAIVKQGFCVVLYTGHVTVIAND
jgi:hydroxyethylthiazole kinase-like sugar kinase family protein